MNRSREVCALALVSLITSSVQAAPLVYEKIAREGGNGIGWIDGQVPAAIAADGTIAFAAQNFARTEENVYVTNGTTLTPITVSAVGVWDVKAVQIEGTTVALTAVELSSAHADGPRHRVRTSTTSAAPLVTVHEGRAGAFNPNQVGVRPDSLALSPNGTLAFSTIRNGQGALFRRAPAGALITLRSGTGFFYNTRGGDVNDAGQFAVQMEYSDPYVGVLSRGILVFDSPEQANTDVDTAIERNSIGVMPMGAIANDGRVAFAIGNALTMQFYDPMTTVTLQPGVYVVTPGPMGEPKSYTQIAGTGGAYKSFGRVDINSAGTVVFEASLDDGAFGIFSGPDANLDKIVKNGEVLSGDFIAWMKLGELNENGQVVFISDDWYSADYQVFRVSNVTTCAGLCDLLRRIRRPWPPLRPVGAP